MVISTMSVSAVSGSSDFNEFIELPYRLYRSDPYWAPPLRSDQRKLLDRRHPFYEHGEVELFLARDRAGQVVGRIAAIDNQLYVNFHQEPVGFFGFFETIDDQDVATALFDAAGQWLNKRELKTMLGPMNYSTNDECGLLIEGFDSMPYILMTHNPPYYSRLCEGAGLSKAKDLLAFRGDWKTIGANTAEFDRWRRINAKIIQRANITIKTADMSRFDREIETLKVVYNQAWIDNWGFVPLTDREMAQMARDLKSFIDPELALFAYSGDEPIGVSISLPDYNQVLRRMGGHLWPFGIVKFLWYRRKINRVRVIALGIVKKWQKRGIAPILMIETIDRAIKKGYVEGEVSWVLEDNQLLLNSIRSAGGQLYKRYRIYQRAL